MSNFIKFVLVLFGIAFGYVIASVETSPTGQGYLSQARIQAHQWWGSLQGSVQSPSPLSSGSPATGEKAEVTSQAAINSKRNAEIFHELFRVVMMVEPKDRGDFGDWVDTLNQGASLEGVYNGLIYSANYKKLEVLENGASPFALRAFGEELAFLEKEMPEPTRFERKFASVGTEPVFPAPSPSSLPAVPLTELEAGRAGGVTSLSPQDLARLSADYSHQFVGSSLFTLKRVLGEEALKVFTSKMDYREKVALWFSKWVPHTVQRGIDFGILLRNNPDEAFHYKWAVENSEDQVKWEVLNRLHRILNAEQLRH